MSDLIDRADFHWDSTDPSLSEEERWRFAAAHIGIFVRWLAERDALLPAEFGELVAPAITAVKTGQMTGTKYISQYCSDKLLTDMIGPEIVNFVYTYYTNEGTVFDVGYIDFVDRILDGNLFRVAEEDMPYDLIRAEIDQKLTEFSEF